MQDRSKGQIRASTGPAAGFDEGRPGGPRSAQQGRPSHTTNIEIIALMKINS